MAFTTLFFLLLSSSTLTFAFDTSNWTSFFWRRSGSASRNVPPQGYYSPFDNGGNMLTEVANTFPVGQGEPINTILSAASDASVLVRGEASGGLMNYLQSFGFSGECLGQHSGSQQGANLGDGNGYLNETAVIRWNYGDPALGSCKETIEGGNHFRYWVQNGADANSGAIFMAVSYEMPLKDGHDIIPNGYNLGRNWLIGNATNSAIPSENLTDSMTFSGSTSSQGYTYRTDVKLVSGLLPNTSDGINHNVTVSINNANAVDGLVAVLTVTIEQQPHSTSSAWRPSPHLRTFLLFVMLPLPLFLVL